MGGCIKKHKLKQYFVVIVFFLHNLLNVQWWKYEYKLQSKLQYYQCQSFATNCHSSDHTSFQCFHFRSAWYFSSLFFCIKQKHVLSLKKKQLPSCEVPTRSSSHSEQLRNDKTGRFSNNVLYMSHYRQTY